MTPAASFTLDPFVPHPLLANAHVQTILAALLPPARSVSYSRVRVDTPDGDFVDLDMPQVAGLALAADAPLVLVLHGLEGDARSHYMAQTYITMAELGLRCVGMNYRSCSGVMNRAPQMYHLGATADVARVFEWLERQYPGVPRFVIGFSLGANVTLKWLGEAGATLVGRLHGAAAVSPPFLMYGQKHPINDGGGVMGAFYRNRILARLKRKVRLKAGQIRSAGGNVYRALTATTLEGFDNAMTAPVHGFKNADDYYQQAACATHVGAIRVPTLVLRALDDPFFHVDVPYAALRANPALVLGITAQGGHVGFMAGLPPQPWAQQQAARFFRVLNPMG